MTTNPPINSLFFWDPVPNLGDAIGPEIVAQPLGRTLPNAEQGDDGVLMRRGSIIHYAPPPADGATDLAVRRPNTTERVGYTGGVFGDPAILDPRREWREDVDDICAREFVFCQSLHGALMAQRYDVPWVWWQSFHGRSATFKWGDWFASPGAEPRTLKLSQVDKARKAADARRATTPCAERAEAA